MCPDKNPVILGSWVDAHPLNNTGKARPLSSEVKKKKKLKYKDKNDIYI